MDEPSLETFLKFSDADLAANRNGVLGPGQRARMVWSGIWRMVFGPPFAIVGVVICLATDNALAMIGGLTLAGIALYLAWRGFAFLTDAMVASVAYLTGPMHKKLVTGKNNSRTYYAVIGPVSKQISAGAYESVRDGENVHLYYAPACRSLLSVEPANAAEPRPGHPFGPDSAHAWNRLRWSWVGITIGAVGLLIGAHAATLAQPVHAVGIETTVSDYQETHGKSTHRYLYVDNDPNDYTPENESAYDPPAPDYYSLIGKPVVIYTDAGSREIIAFRIGGVAYTTDWYVHPEHKTVFEAANGGITALLSLVVLVGGIYGVRVGFRMQGGAPPTVHGAPLMLWATFAVLSMSILTVLFLLLVTHL